MRFFILSFLVLTIVRAQAQLPLVLMEGKDSRSGKPCQLRVVAMNGIYPEDKNFSIELETSYSHDRDRAPLIIAKQWVGQTLRGELGPNKIVIVFTGSREEFQFKNISSFSLSWLHVNHPHNYRCNQMVLK